MSSVGLLLLLKTEVEYRDGSGHSGPSQLLHSVLALTDAQTSLTRQKQNQAV